MTICGGCGMVGEREYNWAPPPHKCPRWDIQMHALRRVANVAAAFLDKDNGAITEKHLRSAVEQLEAVDQKCDQLDQQTKP